jgi:hypothetical protein
MKSFRTVDTNATTSRQLAQCGITSARSPGGIHLVYARDEQGSNPNTRRSLSRAMPKFPERPSPSVLSTSIPLFFIGRNRRGLWVAREAEGRTAGLFLLKRSAIRFACNKGRMAGCATMFLNEPFELDLANEGSRLVAHLAAAIEIVARRAPGMAALIASAFAKWRDLGSRIFRAVASERDHRRAIETDLFRGEYILGSKNDDDLPIP